MNNNQPFVSVAVICRNEEKFIARCLDSIIGNDYPKDRLEVMVVDGMSIDATRTIVGGYQKKFPFIRLVDNQKKFTPFALNIGVRNAKGDYIVFVGSHCTYDKYYLSNSVRSILQSGSDNVGGIWKIVPQGNSLVSKAIVLASSSVLGAGDAHYRRGDSGGAREVDTVFGGCYRKEVFEKIGLFDERLARSQDMEFNIRLKKAGGKIMLFPDIVCNYYPKSDFKNFLIHNFWDGVWAVYPIKFTKMPLKMRHYIPLAFVLGLAVLAVGSFFNQYVLFAFLASVFFYLAVLFLVSVQISFEEKELRFLFLVPVALGIRHFGYGVGSLWGSIKLAINK